VLLEVDNAGVDVVDEEEVELLFCNASRGKPVWGWNPIGRSIFFRYASENLGFILSPPLVPVAPFLPLPSTTNTGGSILCHTLLCLTPTPSGPFAHPAHVLTKSGEYILTFRLTDTTLTVFTPLRGRSNDAPFASRGVSIDGYPCTHESSRRGGADVAGVCATWRRTNARRRCSVAWQLRRYPAYAARKEPPTPIPPLMCGDAQGWPAPRPRRRGPKREESVGGVSPEEVLFARRRVRRVKRVRMRERVDGWTSWRRVVKAVRE
jgi:hypothetical protein